MAGTLYLITFISAIPAVVLLEPILNNPNYVISSGSDARVILGGVLDLINAAACIGTAVVLFPMLKRHNEAAALGFVAARLFEAAVIAVGVVSLFAVVTLRQNADAAGDSASLVTAAAALVALRDWTFLLGPGLVPAVNALLLGSLLYQSKLVPRAIPNLGLVGAPLLMVAAIATMFGINDQLSAWSAFATLPIFLWELSLGVWLTAKGFASHA